jgi:DNA-binding CsgD family transcriptional regulator
MTGIAMPEGRPAPKRRLLDRTVERHAIDELLDVVRGGFSSVLVLRGCQGVGKTALVDYAAAAASGFQVSATTGVESEIDLEYGALYQLLIPFLPRIGDLPVPQRQAIGVAFGLEAGPPPTSFLVGLACLTLLAGVAADQPVMCVIDDAHWIDAESALVLGFVARRLHADRVGVLVTVDDSAELPVFDQLPAVDVGGLPRAEAVELLRSIEGQPLAPQVVDRVLEGTGGNPLALVEASSRFTAQELAEWAYRREPIPIGKYLQERYLGRVRGLPARVQEFLLLVAADVSGDRCLVRRAAAGAGIDADAAEKAAEAAGLVELSGNSVRFRYPLMRAAVYHGAGDADRRRAHRGLGQAATDDPSGAGVWHRAAAAAEPDERLAADLQAAAERARGRGAWVAAAALLRRSVALTSDGARAPREVALARAELMIGHPGTARELADDALTQLPDGTTRGWAKKISGVALFNQGHVAEAAGLLVEAAGMLAADPAVAAEARLAALRAATRAGPAEARKIASTAALGARPAGSAARVSDLLLAGYQARYTKGYKAAVPPLRAAVQALRADDIDPVVALCCFELGAIAAGSLWDDQALLDITDRWLRLARGLGGLEPLLLALADRATADLRSGSLQHAADRWHEMHELMAATRSSGPLGLGSCSEGLLLAYHGEIAQGRAAGLADIRESASRGQQGSADVGRSVVAMADLRAGQFESAFETASHVVRDDLPFVTERTLPELIEAALRSGHRDAAASALAVLAERTAAAGTPWALGVQARCQALLTDGQEADDAYTESVSQLERSHAALDLACAHLSYGQWLRRTSRRRDARCQLRTAHAMFQAMGADGLAGQAACELRATGERARSRTSVTESELTPQESQVANLAADGLTNGDIAAQLFVSPATVAYHLAKVFRKLGLTSRTQLAGRFSAADEGK